MPGDGYHTPDGLLLGRRVMHMREDERIVVRCDRCGKSRVYDPETLRHFRPDCPVAVLQDILPPKCWSLTERPPVDCVRVVLMLDGTMEDLGCSDEG